MNLLQKSSLSAVLFLALSWPAISAPAQSRREVQQTAAYGKLPLYFEPNCGQAEDSIQFLSRGSGYNFLLRSDGATMVLRQPDSSSERTEQYQRAQRTQRLALAPQVIQMQFLGANAETRMTGIDELPGKVNYLLGNDENRWHRNISTFSRVQYEQLYPGVDLICYGSDGQLEYDFLVAPGASASAISLRFDGIRGLKIDPQGDLLLSVAGGEVRQHKPVVYQTVDGIRQELAGGYVLKNYQTVGFQVAQHDPTQPLVIDPVLSYSTYLGGKNGDIGWDIAVDPDGSAYVAGETLSVLTGLVTPGAFQTQYAGGLVDHTDLIGGDAFIAKLNPAGSALVYMTYLGGSGDDGADAIAVDAQGNACLTG